MTYEPADRLARQLSDRLDQVNWLKQEAADLAETQEGPPDELVSWWEDQTALPPWYDEIDNALMIKFLEG